MEWINELWLALELGDEAGTGWNWDVPSPLHQGLLIVCLWSGKVEVNAVTACCFSRNF